MTLIWETNSATFAKHIKPKLDPKWRIIKCASTQSLEISNKMNGINIRKCA